MTSTPYINISFTPEQTKAFQELQKCISNKAYLDNEDDRQQALQVAATVIAFNSSNYTAWWLRRRCLEILNSPKELIDELKGFTRTWLDAAPKSYQGWQHRLWLLQHIQSDSKELLEEELEDVSRHLDDDSKNVCAWEFRQKLVVQWSLPLEREYEYVEAMILSDCRNNSAWNYRQWLCTLSAPKYEAEIRKRETKFGITWLKRTPTNEACFHYLLGMFRDPLTGTPTSLPSLSEIHSSARETIFELAERPSASPLVLELKAAILVAEGHKEEAKSVYAATADTDFTRSRYYEWLICNV